MAYVDCNAINERVLGVMNEFNYLAHSTVSFLLI